MTRYLTLAEYFWLAEQVTGTEAQYSSRPPASSSPTPRSTHPPPASATDDFYPDVIDKAAVLVCRLSWNHPLPDGNKRAAWAALILFLDLNDGTWDPDPPDVDDAEAAMLAIAAHDCRRSLGRRVAPNASALRLTERQPSLVPSLVLGGRSHTQWTQWTESKTQWTYWE